MPLSAQQRQIWFYIFLASWACVAEVVAIVLLLLLLLVVVVVVLGWGEFGLELSFGRCVPSRHLCSRANCAQFIFQPIHLALTIYN